ncbi:MAG: selenocysteine-specific translation elongation factor [Verrucomicrobiota bacterium]|nr:selenocysteine-specific translation elongation factor [Verrucomicrobiota bacterium]
MTEKHFILTTAGHVDHGKTALVKALTGIDTARLPEEKARGITIDLGFAHLELPGISLGLIDVPGHEDFIRNMIAGLGAIDLALLVVAADDGWMPQTEEHWQILNYLDIRQVVIAITKCDLGDPVETEAKVRERIGSLGDVPIVRTSVRAEVGLEELKQTLADVSARLPEAPDIRKPRLFVDRVFTVRGTGTVVTGTLAGGQLARGKNVTLQPQNLPARIRGVQSHNQALEIALPGTRTALNLPDLRLEDIPRGSVLTTLQGTEASRTIDVLLERSDRQGPVSRPLKNASVIQVHFGSARFTARITLLDRRELLQGESAIARLRCTKPAFVFVGDRFIIRDSSGRATIAGGVVLDPDAEGTKFRSTAERTFLQSRAAQPNDLASLLRSQLRRNGVGRRASLLLKSHFAAETIGESIECLARERAIVVHGSIVADADWWQGLRQRASAAIDAEHAAHPERTGLELSTLRASLALNDVEVEDALIADLCAKEFSCAQGAIRRQSHRPSLPPTLAEAGRKIRAGLAVRPFDPLSRKELVPDAAGQKALRFLSETGEVIMISEDVLLSTDAFAQMKARLTRTLRERGPLTASELRQALATSRRVLIPFLERCDRDGLTLRQGDRRSLRPART